MKKTGCIFLLLWLLASGAVYAQPANNSCLTAMELTNLNNWCSEPEEFSTAMASFTNLDAFCWPDDTSPDVWFYFTAEETELVIRTVGASLASPQLVLYEGNCISLEEIACLSDISGSGTIERFIGDLVPGRRYFLRISSRTLSTGTFRLCLNNYSTVPEASSDCISGVVLCNKQPLRVPIIMGNGDQPNEVNEPCFNTSNDVEQSSIWYKWTCLDPGSLTFTIDPLKSDDDIDFVVYRLPGGIEDCANKEMIRCMASGENVGEPMSSWDQCIGPTGLSLGDPDFSEQAGCQSGNNNFLAALDMQAGESYALVILNFSNTGNGFTVSWGGTGTFVGPVAEFEVQISDSTRVCRGEPIIIEDLSSSPNNTIISYEWDFGASATPRTASVPGPHTIVYDEAGPKAISLVLEDSSGCVVRDFEQLEVICCESEITVNAGEDQQVDLGNDILLNGSINLPGSTVFTEWVPQGPVECPSCLSTPATPLFSGFFTLIAYDDLGCSARDSLFVNVVKKKSVYFPNAFTPNGDGVNERFTGYSNIAATEIIYLRVFDRWGNTVYEGRGLPLNNEAVGWDGTFNGRIMTPAVFAWIAEVNFIDNIPVLVSGDVTLLR